MPHHDIFVRRISLPYSVKGVTLPNEDGTFSVYINAALPECAQERALQHELSHIRHDHFYDESPVQENEKEAAADNIRFNEDTVVFARGGGILTGSSRERLLAILRETYHLLPCR